MIPIYNCSRPSEINSLLQKHGMTEVRINTNAIQEDIAKLKDKLNNGYLNTVTNKRIQRENIKITIEYLEKIHKIASSNGGVININWVVNDYVVKTIPFEIMDILEYNIMTMDYLSLREDENLVCISYRSLADMVAFEIMYRDLDETLESVEEKLLNVGMIAIYDSKELTQHFEDSPYMLSKILKVIDSPYIVYNNKTIQDYFYIKHFNLGYYKDVVSYSCKVAMTIIAEDILKEVISKGYKVKLGGITDTSIYLLVNTDYIELLRKVIKSAVLKVFGRRFEVKPAVIIY